VTGLHDSFGCVPASEADIRGISELSATLGVVIALVVMMVWTPIGILANIKRLPAI
jgi:hypothetical protein